MNRSLAKSLPLSTSSFPKLRARNQIYVDKSTLIYDMASLDQKFFLARPRRFGKSLLVSTFASLFKYGLRDFKGLAIEGLWKDEEKYTVVTLDFSLIKYFQDKEEFACKLRELLIGTFTQVGFSFCSESTVNLYSQLDSWINTLPLCSLVLLIDEYDAPLTSCLSIPYLFNEIRGELSNFFAWVKANDEVVRFLFITGITKFSKASIFSELNNLKDISLMPKYSALLGYTHDELRHYFAKHLVEAANILGLSEEELVERLEFQYDGFCFDKTAQTKVFSPWSILNFLSSPQNGFENYWVESAGDPTVLQQYLKENSLRHPSDYSKKKFIEKALLQTSSNDPTHLDDLVLLTQAGYLTIKASLIETFEVGYPNKEVADSLAQIYRSKLLSQRSLDSLGASDLLVSIEEGKVDELFKALNKVLLALDYTKFPITDEATCRSYVQLILTLGYGIKTYIEVHNALGRSDLELETINLHWVFEIKFLKKSNESQYCRNKLLSLAAEQICSRRYGESESSGKRLIQIAAVYSEKERRFVSWESIA